MEKQLLRRQLLEKRRKLGPAEIETGSLRIGHWLAGWDVLQKASTCMVFLSMPDEPQMDSVIQRLIECGKTVCAPRLSQQYGWMDAAVIGDLRSVTTGRLGLRMPDEGCPLIEPGQIDVVLVPGVAFDLAGARLGMGAGYYDRFLATVPGAVLAGVVWSFQVIRRVPVDEHDIAMHWLITENGVYDCMRGKI